RLAAAVGPQNAGDAAGRDVQRHIVEGQLCLLRLPPRHQTIGPAVVSEALRDALHLDRRSIQFALVGRHDLNSSMNCAEQQKKVGLRATRPKALESGSKLLSLKYCHARGQPPPLKVAVM